MTKMRSIILTSVLILAAARLVLAGEGKRPGPRDFNMKQERPAADKLGTDFRNIKSITIEYSGAEDAGQKYTLKVYIDGRYYYKYAGVHLPYEFKQNFKGLSAGSHKLKIEIVDAEGIVLSTQTTNIFVSE